MLRLEDTRYLSAASSAQFTIHDASYLRSLFTQHVLDSLLYVYGSVRKDAATAPLIGH